MFVSAPGAVIAACRATAAKVGYPVPCPTTIPRGSRPFGGTSCRTGIITAAGLGGCSHRWRGWVVGSSVSGPFGEHLVIQASPHTIADPARAVDGPGWYRGAAVRLLGHATAAGRSVAVYDVSPTTNDGSAFADHVVLVWSQGGHTYTLGFHNIRGRRVTEQLDLILLRGVRLVS